MLEKMRTKGFIKAVFWVIVIGFLGFIFLEWGMDITGVRPKGGIIGEVNGQKIRFEDFRNLYWRTIEAARSRSEGELSDRTLKLLADQAWHYLLEQILLQQQARKMNIRVTDEELMEYMRRTPPDIVRQQEIFQTEGKFDPEKYFQALEDPRIDWSPVESYVRALLPLQKLQGMIVATVRVTDLEVYQEYQAKNEKVRVEYLRFAPEDIPPSSVNITEGEIQDYYQGHQLQYWRETQRKLDYVCFEKKPSLEDSIRVRERLQEIQERIQKGEDFAELARLYSEDPGSRDKGGDLGFFGRGEMVKTFEKATFSLKVGQVSDPVQTPFGWHLIKLTDRKGQGGQEKVRASHILLKIEPSPETLSQLREKAEEFAQATAQRDFSQVAAEKELTVMTTGFFSRESSIPTVGSLPQAVDFAFDHQVGDISPVLENEKGFYVFCISGERGEGVLSLEEVRDQVQQALLREKRKKLARKKAHHAQNILQQGKDLRQVARKTGIKLRTTPLFSRRDYPQGWERAPQLIRAAFALNPGEISPIIETKKGDFLLKLVERQEVNQEEFSKERDKLAQKLLQDKQLLAYNAWFERVKKEAKIKDYRHLYYPD